MFRSSPVSESPAKGAVAHDGPVAGRSLLRRIGAADAPGLAAVQDLVVALSRAAEPGDVLRAYAEGIARVRGPFGYLSLSTRGLAPGEYRITRLLTLEEMADITTDRAWPVLRDLPIHTGGLLGDIVREPRPALIDHLALPHDSVVGDALARYRSLMAIPLFDGGEALNWAILLSETPRDYGPADVEESLLRGNLVGGTVRSVLMARDLQRANAHIRREIEQIARIQKSLLPEKLPQITGLTVAAHYEMFDHAGGDYYDFLPLKMRSRDAGGGHEPDPDAPWAFLIADASGHGPAAAVVMAMVHSILHAYPHMPFGPAEVFGHLNAHLCAKRIESSFVTAFLAVYDPRTRSFTYARAGHEPPLLKNPGEGGAVSRLDAVGGLPLGIMEDAEYSETSIFLDPGQSIVMYTDGITDARCADGTHFGIETLERALTTCTGMPDCVVGSVTGALSTHGCEVTRTDDQTIVVLRVDDPPMTAAV